MFKHSIDVLIERDRQPVPRVLMALTNAILEPEVVITEGIFRLGVRKLLVTQLQSDIDKCKKRITTRYETMERTNTTLLNRILILPPKNPLSPR